jgi:hypothetical protein
MISLTARPVSLASSSPFSKRNIRQPRLYAFICRADNTTAGYYFLHPMGTPACHSADCEERGKQFFRDTQHLVDKTGLEIHICANRFDRAFCLLKNSGHQTFNCSVELELLFEALFCRQFFRLAAQQFGTRI